VAAAAPPGTAFEKGAAPPASPPVADVTAMTEP
jgi:hypothetical protein